MIKIELATIVSVSLRDAGTQLVGDHATGATELLVDDCYDFNPGGGSLSLGDETLTYSGFDDDSDTIHLVSPTTADHADLDPIGVLPTSPSKVATVAYPGAGEAIPARVLHVLDAQLEEGVRDPEDQEDILLLVDDEGTAVVLDVLGREVKIDPNAINYPPITNLCTDPQPANRLNWLPATPTNTSAADNTYAGLNFRIDPAGLSYGAPFVLPSTGHVLGTGYDSMVPLTDDLVFALNVRVAAQVSVYARLRVYDDAGNELLNGSGEPFLRSQCLTTQPGRTVDSSFSITGDIGYVIPGNVTTRVWWGVDRDAVLALAPTAALVRIVFMSSHISQPFSCVTTRLGNGSIYAGADVVAFRDADSPGWVTNPDGTSTGPAPQRLAWDEVDHPDVFPPSPHTHPSTDIPDFDPAVEAIVDAAIAALPPVIVPTSQFLPLTTTVGGVPELVWDANDELAQTEVPLP